MLEAHYAIPMTKGVLNCLNIRLDAKTLSFIIDHSETKILIYDTEFAEKVKDIVGFIKTPLILICIEDIFPNTI